MQSVTSEAGFNPNVFAIRGNGKPMPCRLVELDADGWAVVESPNGRRYTFHRDHLVDAATFLERNHRDKVAQVLTGYVFEPLSEKPPVVRCYDPHHRRRSNHVLSRGAGGWLCTCAAFSNNHGWCKHSDAAAERERRAAQQAGEQAPPAVQPVAAEDW